MNIYQKSIEVKVEKLAPAEDQISALADHADSLETGRGVQISGLRVYVGGVGSKQLLGDSVFYSRRADGPYYRWSFEQDLGHWHCDRMNTSNFSPRELYLARWKGVPPELQASLRDHYLE